MNFNYLDIIIVVYLLLTLLIGFKRGFVKEILLLVVSVVAILIAIAYSKIFINYLVPSWANDSLVFAITLIIVFYLTYIIGYFIVRLMRPLFASPDNISLLSRLSGSFLSLTRNLILAVFLISAISLTNLSQNIAWAEAYLLPHITAIGQKVLKYDAVNLHGDLFNLEQIK